MALVVIGAWKRRKIMVEKHFLTKVGYSFKIFNCTSELIQNNHTPALHPSRVP